MSLPRIDYDGTGKTCEKSVNRNWEMELAKPFEQNAGSR